MEMEALENRMVDFINSDLLWLNDVDHEDAIDEFVNGRIPSENTADEKAEIIELFRKVLHDRAESIQRFRQIFHKRELQEASVIDMFVKHLPPSVVVSSRGPHIFEIDLDSDKSDFGWPPMPDRSSWRIPVCTEYELITPGDPPLRPEPPFYPPDVDRAPWLNDLHNWILDLKDIRRNLFTILADLAGLLLNSCPRNPHNQDDKNNKVLDTFKVARTAIDQSCLLPNEDRLLKYRADSLQAGIEAAERILVDTVWPMFMTAEQHLIEFERTNVDNQKLYVAISRYGRVRYRIAMNHLVKHSRLPRLRKEFQFVRLSPDSKPDAGPVAGAITGEGRCSICSDELMKEGEVATRIDISHCCNKPWHSDCLLSWHLRTFRKRRIVRCPTCHVRLSQEQFAEVIEAKTQDLGCL